MTMGIMTDNEETVLTMGDDGTVLTTDDDWPDKGGTERDIMQLVEVMRDCLSVHVIVDGLRGSDRRLIERILAELPELPGKGGTERDIMQLVADSTELAPEIFTALDQLLGNRSSYLGMLVRLARHQHDWRTAPSPIKP